MVAKFWWRPMHGVIVYRWCVNNVIFDQYLGMETM